MKLALTFFFALTSLLMWFGPQGTPPVVCRGKALSIKVMSLPAQQVTGPFFPLRFGGTREVPRFQFQSDKGFRLVIKSRDEFGDFWKRLTAPIPPGAWVPPPPEIDLSKEMVIVAAMGQRPMTGYRTFIDGACEVDGQVEVFVNNVEDVSCSGRLQVLTYPADVVLIPRTDLPIVFREGQIGCKEWLKKVSHLK